MNVYYKLDPVEERKTSAQAKHRCLLTPITREEAETTEFPTVKVVSSEEFNQMPQFNDLSIDFLHTLVEAETNYVDEYLDYVVGSFSIPNKGNQLETNDTFAFYMDERTIIFGDDSGVAAKNLKDIADVGVIGADTTPRCLYVFLKQLLMEDVAYLAKMEDEMEDLEEDILERRKDVDSAVIMGYRRRAMKITSYYEQIGTMTDVLADNENKNLDPEQVQAYNNLSNYADHLASRGESLENYGLELYQLHQTAIDLAQNNIMQTLTVVTVIIAPLTLLTGWFGMNVAMPGLDAPFLWVAVLATCLTIILLLVIHFHRKKWL